MGFCTHCPFGPSTWKGAWKPNRRSFPGKMKAQRRTTHEKCLGFLQAGGGSERWWLCSNGCSTHTSADHSPRSSTHGQTLVRNERIDLLGEPNQGLQVMGLTETRALDFERVFVLDMNEGTVPQTSMPDSFLPSICGTPFACLVREREARYAYLLHRLMQRSKEVHLLYRGAADKRRRRTLSLPHATRGIIPRRARTALPPGGTHQASIAFA